MSHKHPGIASESRTPGMVVENVGGAIITRVTLDLTGPITGKVSVFDAGGPAASMTVELGNHLTMNFISAVHVQHVAGFFALGNQARYGMAVDHSAAWPQARIAEGAMSRTVMTWTSAPTGTAERRQFSHPITGKVYPMLTLALRPITLNVLDLEALNSIVDTMGRAHAAAVSAFADGPDAVSNPLAPSWRPRGQRHHTRGDGWLDTVEE